jgi:hypothetical protein
LPPGCVAKEMQGTESSFNITFNFVHYQYSETNVMQFLFSLLRIKGLYMIRALLAHPQAALNKRHLVYCVHVMSVSCTRIGVPLQSWCSQLT